jgi:hypothetical protein
VAVIVAFPAPTVKVDPLKDPEPLLLHPLKLYPDLVTVGIVIVSLYSFEYVLFDVLPSDQVPPLGLIVIVYVFGVQVALTVASPSPNTNLKPCDK